MNAYTYLMKEAKQRIKAQLQNAVVVWNNDEIVTILNRETDKREINKVIELMNRNDNIKLETY